MTQTNSDHISQIFKQLLQRCNTNAYRLAKETGIDKTYLSKLSCGAIAKPGQDKLTKIALALKIEPSQLAEVFSNPDIAKDELNLIEVNLSSTRVINQQRRDWGEAPDGIVCYDRKTEIEQIKHWIAVERARIIALYGLGGIGKRTLAVEVAKQLATEFDYLIWRDLSKISQAETVIQDALNLFKPDKTESNTTIVQKMNRLVDRLRTHRCLILLNRVETILVEGSSGSYRQNYQAYEYLFRQIAESNHQSCLLLVGNEKPPDIAVWSSCSASVYSWQLTGSTAVCEAILQDKQIPRSTAWKDLIEAYSGHPLAIKIVATIINELFNGNVEEFLRQNTLFLGDLEFIIHQQYQRLSIAERKIIHAIARMTKPLSLPEIAQEFATELRCSQIIGYLNCLRRRSLIEIVQINEINCYTLQPVVRKYINSQI